MDPTVPAASTGEAIFDIVSAACAAIVAVQVLASAIVAITPTDKDDAFLAKIAPWADRLTSFLKLFGSKRA